MKIEFPVSGNVLEEKFPYIRNIFEGFKLNSWNENLFHFIFIGRRLVLSVLIIFTNKIIQLSGGISLCLIVRLMQEVFYIFYTKPFAKKFKNIIFIANEILLLCFYFGIIFPELNIIKIKSEKLATIEIRIVLTALGFNVLVNITENVKNLYFKIKNRFFMNSSKITQIETSVVEIKPGSEQ